MTLKSTTSYQIVPSVKNHKETKHVYSLFPINNADDKDESNEEMIVSGDVGDWLFLVSKVLKTSFGC